MAAATVDTVEIATQAAEAAGALGSLYSATKLLSVARDYYSLYDAQRQFYFSTFQNQVEAPLAAEVFAEAMHTLDYAARADTITDAATGPLGGEVGNIAGWWARRASMYNSTPDEGITEIDADLARLQSDWANYMFRFEEHYVDVHNDIRFNRRLAIHNIGIKQGSVVEAALSTSFGGYEEALNSTADALSATANGAAAYAGYRRGMSDVYDDFDHAEYMRTPKFDYNQQAPDMNVRMA